MRRQECGKSSTTPALVVAQKSLESPVSVQLLLLHQFLGRQSMSSTVSFEEVIRFLEDGYKAGLIRIGERQLGG